MAAGAAFFAAFAAMAFFAGAFFTGAFAAGAAAVSFTAFALSAAVFLAAVLPPAVFVADVFPAAASAAAALFVAEAFLAGALLSAPADFPAAAFFAFAVFTAVLFAFAVFFPVAFFAVVLFAVALSSGAAAWFMTVLFFPLPPLAAASAAVDLLDAGFLSAVFFATMAAAPSHIVILHANRAGTINRPQLRSKRGRPPRGPAPACGETNLHRLCPAPRRVIRRHRAAGSRSGGSGHSGHARGAATVPSKTGRTCLAAARTLGGAKGLDGDE